jgi:hypothetical protein
LVIGQLEEFARRVSEELPESSWETRREVVRALVKQVEVDEQEVRIVYRVSPSPFERGPYTIFRNVVGGVLSPLLSNLFLHYALDPWFDKEVRPRLKGEALLIRYADDFVTGVAREDDARRIMDVLPKRMSKYGLTVHPEKTRLVRLHPEEAADSEPEAQDPTGPGTFDFLGFTHYWGRSLRGGWVIKRETAKGRLKRALQALSDWCRQDLHRPIAVQHQVLTQKLQGHYAYYGITGNFPSLQEFLEGARKIWRRWLSRRRRDVEIPWSDFLRLEQRYGLPRPQVVHSLLSRAAVARGHD